MIFSKSTTAAQLQPQPGGRRRCLRERSLLPAPPSHRALARPGPRPFSALHTTAPSMVSALPINLHRHSTRAAGSFSHQRRRGPIGVPGRGTSAAIRYPSAAKVPEWHPLGCARYEGLCSLTGPAQCLPWHGRSLGVPRACRPDLCLVSVCSLGAGRGKCFACHSFDWDVMSHILGAESEGLWISKGGFREVDTGFRVVDFERDCLWAPRAQSRAALQLMQYVF